MKVVDKKDFGSVDFGVYQRAAWSELRSNYLEYLISPECNTSQKNKDIAAAVLEGKKDLDGQGMLL